MTMNAKPSGEQTSAKPYYKLIGEEIIQSTRRKILSTITLSAMFIGNALAEGEHEGTAHVASMGVHFELVRK